MTTKTTISGAPREYSQAELTHLQEQHRNLYNFSERYITVSADLPYDFIMEVIAKDKEGFALCSKSPISTSSLAFRARMIKPQEIQEKELAVIFEQVKEEYIETLKNEREKYKALLTQQLLEAEEEKERQKQEASKAKKIKEAQQAAEDCYGDLVIPE